MNSNTHYIKAGWMIDGTGRPVQNRTLLTVVHGVISDICNFKDDDLPDPAITTDLSNYTILPPFVDCHVHLAFSSSTDPQVRSRQLTTSYQEQRPRITEHLHQLFSHGVLAVRDGGDRLGHVLRYKNERSVTGNKTDPVILKAAGHAWHRKERYGSFLGNTPREKETLAKSVARTLDSVDHVKVINSGLNSINEFGLATNTQFSQEEITALVKIAGIQRKKTMVHANGHRPVREAIVAGCHSIEHGFFMGNENLQRMAERQTIWVPTAVTMKTLLDNWDMGKGEGNKEVITRTLESQLEQMARAKAYGVQLALGTDSGGKGIPHGQSVAKELQLFMTAGFSLVEAVQCATSQGVKLLDIDTLGKLTKGQPAHFIVVQASPAMLPQKLSCLEAIFLHGRSRDQLTYSSSKLAKSCLRSTSNSSTF